MCLIRSETKTISSLFGSKKRKTFYKKVFSINQSLFKSIIYDHTWKVGWNKSDYNKILHSHQYNKVNNGIHVFVKRPRIYFPSYTMLPIICYKKDLIAISDNNDVAFSKVFLEKRTIQRIIRKRKNQKKKGTSH